MSRTDKDTPTRLFTDEYWDKWYRAKNPHPKRGRLMAREWTNGPGGVKCSCCGVQKNYKAKDKRKARLEILSYVSLSM